MPVIQQTDPMTAALGAIAGYVMQAHQNKQDSQQYDLQRQQVQAQIDDAAARRAQAEQSMDLDRQSFQLQQRAAGIDPATGQPFSYGHSDAELGSAKSSLEHKATIADQMAANAAAKGATAASTRYAAIASGLRTQAHQANQDALAFRKEFDEELTRRAQREHWSEQDRLRAQQIANTYEVGIRNGDIRLQAAHIAANAHLQGISIEQRGAMDRARYTQGQENARNKVRTAATAATAVQRFNASANNDATRFHLLHPTAPAYTPQLLSPPGSSGVSDPAVSSLLTKAQSIPKAQRIPLLVSSDAFKSLTPQQQATARAQIEALP